MGRSAVRAVSILLLILAAGCPPSLLSAQPGGSRKGSHTLAPQAAPAANLLSSDVQVLASSDGHFVAGTTGGDPGAPDDDNKELLFGYPNAIGTSYTTLRVGTGSSFQDIVLGEQGLSQRSVVRNGAIVTSWRLDQLRIDQYLSIVPNADSDRPDTIQAEYRVVNLGRDRRSVGLRVLLDTLIGGNDGAPFFVPGVGRITTHQEFSSAGVPSFWVAWESTVFSGRQLKARSLLRDSGVTLPDRLIMAHWDDDLCPGSGPGLYSAAWDYTITPGRLLLCDSAVAMYYNPLDIAPGQTRTIKLNYGLVGVGNGIELAGDIARLVQTTQDQLAALAGYNRDVATVGDYFLDQITQREAEALINLGFNLYGTFTVGGKLVDWSKVGNGLNHIMTPGYSAAVKASWRGWMDPGASKHWYKPLYDSMQGNREILFQESLWSGARYYASEAAPDLAKEGSWKITKWFDDTFVAGPSRPFRDTFEREAAELAASYSNSLRMEQDEAITRLSFQSLTPAQIAAYRADLEARQRANAKLIELLAAQRDLLVKSYDQARADEANWLGDLWPTFARWGVIGLATLAWDGPGFYVASVVSGAALTVYDSVVDTAAISEARRMRDLSLYFLTGRASLAYSQVALNTVDGINLIRARDVPQVAGGAVAVSRMESLGRYRFWCGPAQVSACWVEEGARLVLDVSNSTGFETTFQPSGAYERSTFLGSPQRLLVQGQALTLAGRASGQVVVPLKGEGWGESPNGGAPVELVIVGATATGHYPVAELSPTWNPQRVPTGPAAAAGMAGISPAQLEAAPTFPYPVSSSLLSVPGTIQHQLAITVLNPFSIPIEAAVSQTLPAQAAVLDAGGGRPTPEGLAWTLALPARSSARVVVSLSWSGLPGDVLVLPGAQVALRDPETGNGDSYAAPAHTVEAPWPVSAAYDFPAAWLIGSAQSLALTLSNITPGLAASGTISLTLTSDDGSILWSQTEQIAVPPGGTQGLAFALTAPATPGVGLLTAVVNVGGQERRLFQEVILFEQFRVALPMVRV